MPCRKLRQDRSYHHTLNARRARHSTSISRIMGTENRLEGLETPVHHYIAFVVSSELDPKAIKLWFRTAKELLPSGLMTSVQVQGPNGGRVSVPLLCKASENRFRYLVPLTRNLTEDEAEPIVEAMHKAYDGDFDVLMSKLDTEARFPDQAIELPEKHYDAICREFAKRQHGSWVKDRLDAGWRYGSNFSFTEKTHPMLKAWDDLPESLRKVDYTHPQALVDLLGDQGYAVIKKEELAGLLKLLRNQT